MRLSEAVQSAPRITIVVSGARGAVGVGVPGPAGGVDDVDTRANLAAIAGATDGMVRVLTEAGREGVFVFDASDLSARVAADTAQGIYVAPASDVDGSSGAWVRQYDGPVLNSRWFGVAPGNTGAQNSAAITAALFFMTATAVTGYGYGKGAGELFTPKGVYDFASTIDILYTVVLSGEEGSGAVGGTTVFRFPSGVTGIRTQRHNTTGATGTKAPTGDGGADGTVIRRLFLYGGYTGGAEAEAHGIHMRAVAVIEDVNVTKFQGDGIHINASIGGSEPNPEGAANCFTINRVWCSENRKGIYINGADVNASLVSMASVVGNRQWGIEGSDFLGVTYVGCHAAANGWDGAITSVPTACVYAGNRYAPKVGADALWSTTAPSGTTADNAAWLYISPGGTYWGVVPWVSGTTFREGGAFKTDNPNSFSVFAGCYSEGDQNPSQTSYPTVAVGGLHGAGWKGNGGKLAGYGLSNSEGAIRSLGFAAIADNGYGNLITHELLQFMTPSNQITLEWFGTDLASTVFRSAVGSNWHYRITGEGSTANVGPRKVDFPNGFGIADKKWFPGTAAPTSGAHAVGDFYYNIAPSVSGPFGWRCITAGTPGTWEAVYLATPAVITAGANSITPSFGQDLVKRVGADGAITLNNPTGTAIPGWGLAVRLKDNGTARAISYGSQYRAIGVTLPTTTVVNKTLYLGMIYNADDAKWDVVSVAQEA